jgi:hypothetical protein
MANVSLLEVTLVERVTITHTSYNLKRMRDFMPKQPKPSAALTQPTTSSSIRPSSCGKNVNSPEKSE